MEIQIKVISTETVKPSSPTPKSQQKHYLSFLDQFLHSSFTPFIYFYQSSNPKIPNSEKSNALKKSLSETLSRYYPLAGRLAGNLYVDCNDGGVPFSEAEAASCDLSQVIIDPNPKNLKKFVPISMVELEPKDLCMAVQATYFRCGGLAVGILISHKIADGLSFIMFANTWSAVARDGHCRGVPPPKFDAAAYFPPLDRISGRLQLDAVTGMIEEEVAGRIFTFPASEIAALQERYSGGRRPSRVAALSAYIWTRFVSATGMRSDPDKTCSVQHAMNLRTRADPPLSQYHFGNIVLSSKARVAAGDGGAELLRKVGAAVAAVDGGYVARLKDSENHLKEIVDETKNSQLRLRFIFSSLCGFPLYEADFGWGEPVRVRMAGLPYKNTVTFLDTKSGGGIEALIHLTKPDMEKFEAHLEPRL